MFTLKGRGRLTVLVAAVGAVACDGSSDTTGPDSVALVPIPTELRLQPRSLDLFVPTASSVSASVLDQTGAVMTGHVIAFASRDTTTARVDSTGSVTPLGAGETWIVARSGTLSDSVEVSVRYHVLPGEARARVTGDEEWVRSWEPVAFEFDFLGTEDRDRLAVGMINLARADTGLVVFVPGMAAEGRTDLSELDIGGLVRTPWVGELEQPLAYLIVESEEEIRYYTGLAGSYLEIEDVVPAPGPGGTGKLSGRLVMRARGHVVHFGGNGSWTTTNDTVTVYADFAAEYGSAAIGQASYRLEAGDAPMVVSDREAWWSLIPWLGTGYGWIRLEDAPHDVSIFLPAPATGTAPFDSVHPSQRPEAGVRYVNVHSWSPGYVAVSAGGTLTIAEVTDPQGDLWGEMRGNLDADLLRWNTQGDPGPSSGRLMLEFHVPIVPEDAWTVVATEPVPADRPWRRHLRLRSTDPIQER